MSQALVVWNQQQRVGRLIVNGARQMAFIYDGEWLLNGWPISCSLPLNETGDFLPPDLRGHHFFANLLPEGGARDRLVRRLGVADDDFLLLKKLGGDCAGALQLLPEGEAPATEAANYIPIEEGALEEAIQTGRGQWVQGDAPPRLSLAGAQDKIAVRAESHGEGWRFLLPEGGAASTHILKLPVQDLRHVPLFEAYTTYLANQLELPVAPVQPIPLGDHLLSLSQRFDRRNQDSAIQRLHQEDLCQAQGLSRTDKYTRSPEAFAKVAELLREHSLQPARDIQALVNWQVFNALAGNTDGHLKNLALLAVGDGWQLAPFYDLVCTLAIPHVSHRLALPVGSKDDPQNLHRNHWDEFAHQLGVSPRLVKRTIQSQATHLCDEADNWLNRFREQYGELPALDCIHAIVRKQSIKALRDWA